MISYILSYIRIHYHFWCIILYLYFILILHIHNHMYYILLLYVVEEWAVPPPKYSICVIFETAVV